MTRCRAVIDTNGSQIQCDRQLAHFGDHEHVELNERAVWNWMDGDHYALKHLHVLGFNVPTWWAVSAHHVADAESA